MIRAEPPRFWQRPEIVIACLAVAVRLVLAWKLYPGTYESENVRAALTLASKGYLGDPFSRPTGPTAHVAPFYPAFLALILKVVGVSQEGLLWARSVIILIFGGFLATLPTLSRRLGLGRPAGLAAAVVFAIPGPPIFVWMETMGQHEGIFTTMVLAVLTVLTFERIRSAAPTAREAVLLGGAWGAGCLVSPTLVLPALALIGLGVWWHRRTMGGLRWALVFPLALAAVASPWIVRNAVTLGKPSFIRDNFAYELAMSYAENAAADMEENMLAGRRMTEHPIHNPLEAERMRELGETAYYEEKGGEALRWIAGNARAAATLTLAHAHLFLLPTMARQYHLHFYLPLLVLFAISIPMGLRQEPRVTLALVAVLLSYAAPHMVVQSSARYSYPVLWIMVFMASWAAFALVEDLRRRMRSRPGTPH